MNNTYFGAIHYDIQLDIKLDHTIGQNFQEMSLSELKICHHLSKLENITITRISSIKKYYAGLLLSSNRSNFINYEGYILWFYTCTKKLPPLHSFSDKSCYKRIRTFYKN